MQQPKRSHAHGAGGHGCVGRSFPILTHTNTLPAPTPPAQHAERLHAQRLVLVGADEWARGAVSVRDLAKREQQEVGVAALVAATPPTA